MKRITTIFLTFLCVQAGFQALAQGKAILTPPRIDKNVELLSIVFRLAGNPEYNHTNFKRYTDAIEAHFGAHRDHEMVLVARSLRAWHGISYDAVMSMAVHLDGKMDLRTDFTDNSLEQRWKNVDKEHFVALLKKFAADTGFDEFYESNAGLYTGASKRFGAIYEAMDLGWYTSFFGREPTEEFVIINGLSYGPNNNGPSVERSNGGKEVYAVMGAASVDDAGMVVFPMENYFPVLIHEFNHSFVNHLTAGHREALRDSGEKLFAKNEKIMRRQAYGSWETVLNEALVRAAVIKYMNDHGDERGAKQLTQSEIKRGFTWIGELVAELEKYDGARDTYPTLDDYMPRLAEAYGTWAKK